jgi:PAS domain S-box-containing protein
LAVLAENKPISILMIENDSIDAELCAFAFQKAGVSIRTDIVQTQEEFHLKMEKGRYDVILADYNLAGWTGLDAFEYTRRQGRDIPFILVTGAIGDEVAVECIKRGVSDYVLKDRLARLPVAVRRAIEEKALREESARAERLAWEKERRFLSLMEHSADGIVLLNPRGVVVFSNRAEDRILGYAAEERVGMDFFEWVHPQDAPRVTRAFERLGGRPGSRDHLQFRYRTKEGSWRWLECILINLSQEPAVQGIVVNYRDISERKEAEEEIRRLNEVLESRVAERTAQLEAANRGLRAEVSERKRAENVVRESQERFRLLVDGVRDYAIYMLGPQGRVVSWNAGAERIKGYRAEEIVGRHYSCFYTAEDAGRGQPREDLRVAATAGRLEAERSSVRKDGSVFLASIVLTALHDRSGRLRGFSNVTRDITEHRRAHEALERLRMQQQLILNSAGDGICGLDESGICTFINPAGAQMASRDLKELTGKPLDPLFLQPVREDGRKRREVSPIQAALKDGTAYHIDDEVLVRKDGTLLAVDYVVTPILNEAGRIFGAVVVFRDATGKRAVETMKDEFISVVSHEVRTPLTAIRGALGLLATGRLCQSREKCQAMVKAGVENTDRLVRLVGDILDLERIESGTVSVEKKPCDASSLLEQAVALMRVTAESRGITMSSDAHPLTFWADPDRIMQVLINLLSNAIKFSPQGSAIHANAGPKDGEVVFSVRDTGRGIPPNKLSQIFERFQQVDAGDSREKGGTGLGLAICRSIVTQHNGRIWVESTPGQGSTFFFSLPAHDPSTDSHRGMTRDVEKNIAH